MQLTLERVTKKVGAQTWLYPQSIAPRHGAVTVLLGATQAGKTSLMRLMAGLDTPTEGQVRVDGKDVTGVPVRERNVAMVYQQFINYPSLKVADNIGSPLKLRGEKNVDAKVRELADKLHIGMFLDRYPAELSGGQQQRVALARAYGARISKVIGDARSMAELGAAVAPGLHERELRYLQDEEWACSADDVLWRRSKLGLHFTPEQRERVGAWMQASASRQQEAISCN